MIHDSKSSVWQLLVNTIKFDSKLFQLALKGLCLALVVFLIFYLPHTTFCSCCLSSANMEKTQTHHLSKIQTFSTHNDSLSQHYQLQIFSANRHWILNHRITLLVRVIMAAKNMRLDIKTIANKQKQTKTMRKKTEYFKLYFWIMIREKTTEQSKTSD